jgi:hypothetical protein
LEVIYLKPYRAGYYYYSPVDYQGGLPYAELEEEIANYHINNIQNGLAPSMLINFNNGVPSEEERRQIEMQIAQKFSGSSNSGKFILAFNDNKELAATIDPVQLSDAADQYQFLSTEATQKLMVAHRIVSPMLLGIKDSTGLGNNADELKTASTLLDNIVIRPKQEIGEIINEDEWELVDERPVDYEAEQALSKYAFASTGSAFPNAKSSQDGVTEEGKRYKVRYAYAPEATKANSREFCKKMVSAGKVYRKEDIERMGSQAVNAGFGEGGALPRTLFGCTRAEQDAITFGCVKRI